MSWWRRTRKTEPEAVAPRPPQRSETDVERIMRWRKHFAEKDKRVAAERTRQDTLDAEWQARRDEAERERIAAHLARNGSYFPGDALDDPRQPRMEFEQISGEDPSQSGGDAGPWRGFFRLGGR